MNAYSPSSKHKQTAAQRAILTSDAFFRQFVPVWLAFSLLLTIYAYFLEPTSLYAGIISLACGVVVYVAMRRKHTALMRWLFIAPLFAMLLVAPWLVNGIRTPLLVHSMPLLIFAGWMLGTRAMWMLAVPLSVSVIALWYCETIGIWTPPQALRGVDMWLLSLLFSLFLTAVVLTRFIHNYRVDLQREISLQERLQTTLEFNALVINSSPVAIRVFGPLGQCLTVNDAYVRLMGKPHNLLLKENLHESSMQNTILAAECLQVLRGAPSAEHEVQITTEDGRKVWLHAELLAFERDGQRHLLAHFLDVTDRHRATQELKQLAFYDSLTGLANRRLFEEHFHQCQLLGARNKEWSAIALLDLNQFKQLNDLHGHAAGDRMLQEVAVRLQHTVRASDVIARFGGDEFTLLLQNLGKSEAQATHHMRLLYNKLHNALAQTYNLDSITHEASASIGFTLIDPEQYIPLNELLRQADAQMYANKKMRTPDNAASQQAASAPHQIAACKVSTS